MSHDLFMKINNSDGVKFINKMHTHSFSQNIFHGNLREIKEALDLVENIDIGIKLMSQEHRDAGNQVYKEVNRLFHNFLSSAKTLIEHTRIFMDTHFKNSSVHKAYTHKVKMEFAQDELSRFIQDLRNYMLHQGLPHNEMSLKFDNKDQNNPHIESTISLNIEKLNEWNRWSSGSKKYLQKQNENLKLSILVEEYSKKIIGLHEWLEEELYKYYEDDLKELETLQNEYQKQSNETNKS